MFNCMNIIANSKIGYSHAELVNKMMPDQTDWPILLADDHSTQTLGPPAI